MDTDKILLKQFIINYPAQAAQTIEKLTDEEIVAFLEQIPLSLNLHLINQISTYRGAKCLQLLRPTLAKELIENIEIPLAESLLRQCKTPARFELLDSLNPKLATILRQKLEYEADTIGALMTPSVFALDKSILVEDAIDIVKRESERISSVIYIVNHEDKLEGNIQLQELFFADPSSEIGLIMDTAITKFVADMSIQSISNHPGWQIHRSIPVIDRTEKLLGVLDFALIQISTGNTTGLKLNKDVLETSNALGELYLVGLTGLLQSISR